MTDTPTKLNQLIPETPRAGRGSAGIGTTGGGLLTNSNKPNITPSFSFGLGFLPSFQLGSPRNANIMSAFSPQRFFQISNNLNRVLGEGHRRKFLEDFIDHDFNSFTGHKSPSTTKNSKFLESLGSAKNEQEHEHDQEHEHEHEHAQHTDINDSNHSHTTNSHTTDDNMDLWSLGYDNSHNQTTLTSIYEEASPLDTKIESKVENSNRDSNAFLTPNKIFLNNKDNIKLKSDILPENEGKEQDVELAIENVRDDDKENHISKKRKLSPTPQSPSFDIAAKIDTIASPRGQMNRRKSSIVSASISSADGWNAELDDVLLNAYYKYKTFKENQPTDSFILKKSSQNKILSRMMENKSGSFKSSQQIANRLTKLVNGNNSEQTRNEQEQQDSEILQTSANISSSPIVGITGALKCSPIIDDAASTRSISHSNPPYELSPKEMCISFNGPSMETHYFSKYDSSNACSTNGIMNKEELIKTVCPSMKTEISSLSNLLIEEQIPIIIANHSISLRKENSLTPISSTSPFTSTPLPRPASTLENGGLFKSFIKIIAKFNDATGGAPYMLNWRCRTQIYNDDRIIFKTDDHINGYSTGIESGESSFELQIPFLKNFWSGFLTFLCNGGDNSLDNLYVTQIIYEGDEIQGSELTNDTYKVRGSVLHKFKLSDFYSEEAKFEIVRLVLTEEKATVPTGKNITTVHDRSYSEVEDDNATVAAASSPYKSSPKSDIAGSKNLKIDIARTQNILSGPASAPIYNATVVHKLNQESLNQREKIRLQLEQQMKFSNEVTQAQFVQEQQFNPAHVQGRNNGQFFQQQPALIASQSTGDIHQFLQHQQTHRNNSTGSVFTPKLANSQFASPKLSANNQMFVQQPMVQPPPQPNAPLQQTLIQQPQMNPASQFAPMQLQHPPQQFMNSGNSFTPFNGLQQQMQGQFLQMQQRQQMLQLPQDQLFQQQFHPQNSFLPQQFQQPTFQQQAQTQISQVQTKRQQGSNRQSSRSKDNKPMEITFGPILEYDPSSQPGASSRKASTNGPLENGIYRFPLNTQVSMYKPKKR